MKKGSGGRITSLTLAEGDGARREGAARRCDGKRCGPAATRPGGRRAPANGGRLRARRSAAGGDSPHCATGSCRRRLGPAAMAAATAPFRSRAAAPRRLPMRRGHGRPATAPVPRGPLPRPRRRRGRPPPLASARCPLRKCPRVAPGPEPCQRPRGRLLLTSFLPSFVTRPGRRRRRRHKPAFARVGGCSV